MIITSSAMNYRIRSFLFVYVLLSPFINVLSLISSALYRINRLSFESIVPSSKISTTNDAFPSKILNSIKSIYSYKFEGLSLECVDIINASLPLEAAVALSPEYRRRQGLVRNISVTFDCQLYSISSAKYMRVVKFYGGDYNVFNMIVIPNTHISSKSTDSKLQSFNSIFIPPILGIDIVTIKNNAIIAIDFQPLIDEGFSENVYYQSLRNLFDEWAIKHPNRSSLPDTVQEYFSPFAIFMRIDSRDESSMGEVHRFARLYCQTYAKTMKQYADYQGNSTSGTVQRSLDSKLRKYLDYRRANDPAANILVAAFGKNWTEDVLSHAVFPYEILS